MNSNIKTRTYWLLERAAIPLAIAIVVFTAHYTYRQMLGLYEDDYWAIGPNLGRPISELWPMLEYYFHVWPQGRPLNHFLPMALASVGSSIGGLVGVYTLAYIWLTVNCLLVWGIARRLLSPRAALIAALAYALFPADSTRILLVHAAHVQGSMTFMLAGTLLWLRGGWTRWIGYPIAALSLLSYETAYLPFLALPLLAKGSRRVIVKTWIVHVFLCVILVGTVTLVRFNTGDSRVFEATSDQVETIHRSLTSMWIGPKTSATQMAVTPITGLRHLDSQVIKAWLWASLAIAVAWLSATRIPPRGSRKTDIWPSWLGRASSNGALPWWWIVAFAIVVWSGSYALTLTNYPPNQIVGRLTSTHMAASFGASLAVAALLESAMKRRRWISLTVLITSYIWAFGLIAYQHQIQHAYVFSWKQQRLFWHQIVEKAPDVGPGWSVIIDGTPAPSTAVIGTNSWADLNVFSQIFGNIYADDAPMFAHLGVVSPATLELHQDSEGFLWKPKFWGGPEVRLDPKRLVLFHSDGQFLTRVMALDTSAGRIVTSAVIPSELRLEWPETPTARLLFPEQYLKKLPSL